jgi:hypothetical protein
LSGSDDQGEKDVDQFSMKDELESLQQADFDVGNLRYYTQLQQLIYFSGSQRAPSGFTSFEKAWHRTESCHCRVRIWMRT